MGRDVMWPPAAQMRTAAIASAINRLTATGDRAAMADPLSMAVQLSGGSVVVRDHLRVISAAIVDLYAGVYSRLLVLTPPQVGKTTLAAVWAPFWWMARNRMARVAVASYANQLAIARGRSVRRLVHSHGHAYGLTLTRGANAVNDWELDTGGGMISVGIGAGLTGRGADLLIVDDPHKDRAEAESMPIREAVHDWWSAVGSTRLSPGAPVMLIQTRWHTDDLAGRLIAEHGTTEQGGTWKVIKLPAIAVDDNDPLCRAPGEPLPHPLIAVGDTAALAAHWALKRAEMTVRDFAAVCQADPQPVKGALLSEAAMRAARNYHPTAGVRIAAVAVDPSGGGRSTAGIVGGWLGDDGILRWAIDASDVMDVEVWPRRVCEVVLELDADRVVVETNYGGKMATLVIRTAWEALAREDERYAARLCPRIVVVNARRSKLLRAEPVAHQLMTGHIELAAPLPDLVKEWTSWQSTDPNSPGRIDASVHLSYALLTPPSRGSTGGSAVDVSRAAVAAGSPNLPGASRVAQVPRRDRLPPR